MLKLIAKLFGTKSEKDIKRIMPLVQQANQEGQKLVSLSNDELRNETRKLQDFINQELKAVDDKLAGLHQKIANDKSLEINEKEAVFAEIDKLETERNKDLEKVLLKILPTAFAIVRETARRFKENETLEVTAQDYDRQWAAKHENIKISGDKAAVGQQVDGRRQPYYLGHGALRCAAYRWYCSARRKDR